MLISIAALTVLAEVPATPPPAHPDPIVCKRDRSSDVGTHMRPKPVCMKKSDWDLVEKHTQNELRSLQERSAFDPGRAEGHRPQ